MDGVTVSVGKTRNNVARSRHMLALATKIVSDKDFVAKNQIRLFGVLFPYPRAHEPPRKLAAINISFSARNLPGDGWTEDIRLHLSSNIVTVLRVSSHNENHKGTHGQR